MAFVLRDFFRVIEGLASWIIPGLVIGSGEPNGGEPSNDVGALLDNDAFLRSYLNPRRLYERADLSNPAEESTLTSSAPALPLAVSGNGVLRFRCAAKISAGRESANSETKVEVDHEAGTVHVLINNRDGSTLGKSYSHTATTRTFSSTTLTGVGNAADNEIEVRIYMGATSGSSNHKLYAVRVTEQQIPLGDL